MPRTIVRAGRFKGDYKRMKRRGKDMSKILRLMTMLADEDVGGGRVPAQGSYPNRSEWVPVRSKMMTPGSNL